jgi:aspartate kinase
MAGPVVLKFGGTSVQDETALLRLVNIVARTDGPRIVVVSALAGVTDFLVEAAHAAAAGERAGSRLGPVLDQHVALARAMTSGRRREHAIEQVTRFLSEAAVRLNDARLDAAGRDAVLACGELASSCVVAAALADAGVSADWVDARRVVVTDDRHGAARPRLNDTRAAAERELGPRLEAGFVPVLGGFVGATASGVPTTLGRGGSDYSAGLVGAVMDACRVEIWTDVDGLLSADPSVVVDAVLLDRLSGVEAYDLARFGARVLHAGALEPVAVPQIPVVVRNSRRPAAPGTEIRSGVGSAASVAGIAHRPAVSVIDLASRDLGASVKFLSLVAASVDHGARHAVTPIVVSPQRAILAVDEPRVAQEISAQLASVADVASIERGALVAVVGSGVQSEPAVWRAFLNLQERSLVSRIVQSSSGCALVGVAAPGAAEDVVRELHGCVFDGARAMEVA